MAKSKPSSGLIEKELETRELPVRRSNDSLRGQARHTLDLNLNKKVEPGYLEKLAGLFFKMPEKGKQEVTGPDYTNKYDFQGRAALDSLQAYPGAAARVRNVMIGQDMPLDRIADWHSFDQKIRLSNRLKDYRDARSAMDHELGHAQRLGHGSNEASTSPSDTQTATTLGNESAALHTVLPKYGYKKDIHLPLELKGLSPKKK